MISVLWQINKFGLDGKYLVSMLLLAVLVYSEIHLSWIHTPEQVEVLKLSLV